MENNEEKICQNCKYYQKLYVIRKDHYRCAGERCVNLKFRRVGDLRKNCTYWEDGSGLKEERISNIKTTLRDMQKSLKQIIQILQDED